MNLEDLEEALQEMFPDGFEVDVDDDGQIIINTNLYEDSNSGELIPFDRDTNPDPELDQEDLESYDESYEDD